MKDALALALVHFIWQGALLALVGALLMQVAKAPAVRYAIGVATMLAMLLAPVMTFLALRNAGDGLPQAAPKQGIVSGPNAAGAHEGRALFSLKSPLAANTASGDASTVVVPTTWILNVWAVGVMLLSLRFAGGWVVARRLATYTLTPVGDELQLLAAQMAARLNVRGAVRVCASASVAVPIMIGWLRPVIVLPPAALAALPFAQLEALLAHELAHIRRHDYLVNLLQTGVETICFYHPAVWWISRQVRRHREHCCDDIAVGVCDRLTYVTALSSLASISAPELALSAAGGSLRDRVRRLIEPTTHSASPKGAWIAMLPILLVVSFVAPYAWSAQTTMPASAAFEASAAAPAAAATTAPEAIAVEQARPATVAREAARAQARERAEQAKVREVGEETQARRDTSRALEVERQVARELEALSERQKATEEIARLRIRRQLEDRLRGMELTFARQKELVDRGLSTRNDLAAAEQQLNQMRQQHERVMTQHELTNHAQELRHELELRRQIEVERHGLTTTHRDLLTLEPTVQLQAQDRLTITIDGEPDLPSTYTVRADGSIRFPFLGSIRVQGSTTAQVQSAIEKLISDRGLARNPVVTVSAGRSR